jgi:hypothetical protein
MQLRLTLTVLSGAAVMALAGCGPNCQNTCNKLYQPSECNVERPGRSADQLINTCRDTCEDALNNPGELGDYNPSQQRGSSTDYDLVTDRQAAAWMDCVAETSCDLFEKGYCPPVW